MTIWKYPIPASKNFSLQMPEHAEILCVKTQRNQPVLYALVDPKAPMGFRQFRVYATGEDMGKAYGRYVGTFLLDQGSLVFHLFD